MSRRDIVVHANPDVLAAAAAARLVTRLVDVQAAGRVPRLVSSPRFDEYVLLPMPRHRVDGGGDEARRFAAFEEQLAATDFRPHRGTIASAHQMGTIRLGADPRAHPADPRGRVRRDVTGTIIAGLYVADTSTFPTGIGVNPMVGVMTMARRVEPDGARGGSAAGLNDGLPTSSLASVPSTA